MLSFFFTRIHNSQEIPGEFPYNKIIGPQSHFTHHTWPWDARKWVKHWNISKVAANIEFLMWNNISVKSFSLWSTFLGRWANFFLTPTWPLGYPNGYPCLALLIFENLIWSNNMQSYKKVLQSAQLLGFPTPRYAIIGTMVQCSGL